MTSVSHHAMPQSLSQSLEAEYRARLESVIAATHAALEPALDSMARVRFAPDIELLGADVCPMEIVANMGLTQFGQLRFAVARR